MLRKLLIRSIQILFISSLSFVASGQQLVTGEVQVRDYHFDLTDEEIEYRLYVPTSYRADTASPLIVLLHGLGGTPRIIEYDGILEEAEQRGYIVVAPYGYNKRGWYGVFGPGKSFFNDGPEGPTPENIGLLSETDVINVFEMVNPIFIAQGDADELLSVELARRWVARMEELEMAHAYVEIAGGDHNEAIARNAPLISQIFDFFDKYSQ